MSLINLMETRKQSITVGFMFENNKERLHLTPLNGEVGFAREVTTKNIHRPGLALAGYTELFTYDRVQVFGNTEIRYLQHQNFPDRVAAFEKLFEFDIPCIFITNENSLEDELLVVATAHNVSVFTTPLETTTLVTLLSDFLDDQFARQTFVHGSFIDVYGIGVLIMGRSGIGKSEVALDLLERGHRLVADDVVIVTRKGEGILIGTGTDLVQHFMEIRGLGIIDIRSVFGIRSIRYQKRVEVIIELEEWDPKAEYTRTGLDNDTINILGVDIQHIKLPIFPGKNVTVITEVIALNYLLKHYGYDAPKEFSARLEKAMIEKRKGKRAIDYFEQDYE